MALSGLWLTPRAVPVPSIPYQLFCPFSPASTYLFMGFHQVDNCEIHLTPHPHPMHTQGRSWADPGNPGGNSRIEAQNRNPGAGLARWKTQIWIGNPCSESTWNHPSEKKCVAQSNEGNHNSNVISFFPKVPSAESWQKIEEFLHFELFKSGRHAHDAQFWDIFFKKQKRWI